MGESNTVVSACMLYKHLQQYCSHQSICQRLTYITCYVPTQLFLACTCVYLFLVSPVAIFRTGFPFVEYCSGSFRPCLQSDY